MPSNEHVHPTTTTTWSVASFARKLRASSSASKLHEAASLVRSVSNFSLLALFSRAHTAHQHERESKKRQINVRVRSKFCFSSERVSCFASSFPVKFRAKSAENGPERDVKCGAGGAGNKFQPIVGIGATLWAYILNSILC